MSIQGLRNFFKGRMRSKKRRKEDGAEEYESESAHYDVTPAASEVESTIIPQDGAREDVIIENVAGITFLPADSRAGSLVEIIVPDETTNPWDSARDSLYSGTSIYSGTTTDPNTVRYTFHTPVMAPPVPDASGYITPTSATSGEQSSLNAVGDSPQHIYEEIGNLGKLMKKKKDLDLDKLDLDNAKECGAYLVIPFKKEQGHHSQSDDVINNNLADCDESSDHVQSYELTTVNSYTIVKRDGEVEQRGSVLDVDLLKDSHNYTLSKVRHKLRQSENPQYGGHSHDYSTDQNQMAKRCRDAYASLPDLARSDYTLMRDCSTGDACSCDHPTQETPPSERRRHHSLQGSTNNVKTTTQNAEDTIVIPAKHCKVKPSITEIQKEIYSRDPTANFLYARLHKDLKPKVRHQSTNTQYSATSPGKQSSQKEVEKSQALPLPQRRKLPSLPTASSSGLTYKHIGPGNKLVICGNYYNVAYDHLTRQPKVTNTHKNPSTNNYYSCVNISKIIAQSMAQPPPDSNAPLNAPSAFTPSASRVETDNVCKPGIAAASNISGSLPSLGIYRDSGKTKHRLGLSSSSECLTSTGGGGGYDAAARVVYSVTKQRKSSQSDATSFHHQNDSNDCDRTGVSESNYLLKSFGHKHKHKHQNTSCSCMDSTRTNTVTEPGPSEAGVASPLPAACTREETSIGSCSIEKLLSLEPSSGSRKVSKSVSTSSRVIEEFYACSSKGNHTRRSSQPIEHTLYSSKPKHSHCRQSSQTLSDSAIVLTQSDYISKKPPSGDKNKNDDKVLPQEFILSLHKKKGRRSAHSLDDKERSKVTSSRDQNRDNGIEVNSLLPDYAINKDSGAIRGSGRWSGRSSTRSSGRSQNSDSSFRPSENEGNDNVFLETNEKVKSKPPKSAFKEVGRSRLKEKRSISYSELSTFVGEEQYDLDLDGFVHTKRSSSDRSGLKKHKLPLHPMTQNKLYGAHVQLLGDNRTAFRKVSNSQTSRDGAATVTSQMTSRPPLQRGRSLLDDLISRNHDRQLLLL